SLTYGLQPISGPGITNNSLPSWVTFSPSSPSAIFNVPVRKQGTYLFKANVTGSNPPNPPSGNHAAYYAETYLTLNIPDQSPSTWGTISCPAGKVGDTIVCSFDLSQIFRDGD